MQSQGSPLGTVTISAFCVLWFVLRILSPSIPINRLHTVYTCWPGEGVWQLPRHQLSIEYLIYNISRIALFPRYLTQLYGTLLWISLPPCFCHQRSFVRLLVYDETGCPRVMKPRTTVGVYLPKRPAFEATLHTLHDDLSQKNEHIFIYRQPVGSNQWD